MPARAVVVSVRGYLRRSRIALKAHTIWPFAQPQMSMPEATATAIAQPQMTPMMTVVPDGVAPGGQFMVQTMSGCVMVACPDTSKPGDQIQIMVPATMAAPQPTAVQTPTFPSHPSAYAVDGSRPNLQNGIVSLPQPVYRSSDGGISSHLLTR